MSTLSTLQAAELMNVHPKTVEDLIRQGTIPAAKIGRAWVMLERDVLRYVEDQIINQTAQRLGIPKRKGRFHEKATTA